MRILVGNQAAIKQIQNEVTSSGAKPVDLKLKFFRDARDKEVIK